MRVPSSAGASSSQASPRGLFHPYSPASSASSTKGSWLFSDSSEESSSSAGGSLVSDVGRRPVTSSRPHNNGPQLPRRLVLYPTPGEPLRPSDNIRGCPTLVQYLAVEACYVDDHAPARRMKALITYESMCEIAQVLAQFHEPPQENGRSPALPTTGIMSSSSMRHWARSKFALSRDGVVVCKGKQVLVREQFYSALCWAHLESDHGGRDKTSRMLWRFAGVPKELIMRFVASCPTCIAKATAIRRTSMNFAATEKSESTSDATVPSAALSPNPENVSLPPLREVLSTIFDGDDLQMPPRVPSVLDSPTNFSPVGSAFDEAVSPPQGYVAQHGGYDGISSPPSADAAPLETLPALQHVLMQIDSLISPTPGISAETSGWNHFRTSDNDIEESNDDSCISDDSVLSTSVDYRSSPYSCPPARDALMFAWSAAPMQRQAATEGVGLSPPSSPLMGRYARLASPMAYEDSPSATMHLLADSPITNSVISGWSPSSQLPTSPAVTYASRFQSPIVNGMPDLYDTPLRRFSDRTFEQRWEAMYSARNVDLSHLQGLASADPLASTEEHTADMDDSDFQVSGSSLGEGFSAHNPIYVEESIVEDDQTAEVSSDSVQYSSLGFVQEPIGRARAHSHSLGLSLQTEFSDECAPTPPLTAISTLSARSPVTPGLATPGNSLLMQIAEAYKSDGYSGNTGKDGPAGTSMMPWAEGMPAEHDPLAPHNVLNDWINMDYVQTGDE